MMQLSLSHAHLMHTGMLAWLPLTWASESGCCHFLASAAVAIPCQYSCQLSNNTYTHLISSPCPSISALLLLPSDVSPPPPFSIFLPLLPVTSIWLLDMPPLPSKSWHHMLCTIFYAFPRLLCHPPSPYH
ncbi:hypothetical protein ID866_11882 [Astraeus odoratus]|nr:hypothetical protein ID866_11882 [Astraeus odoratus]